MIITRRWAMPTGNTFEMKPVNELIQKYWNAKSIDPFANSCRIASVTNDIDPSFDCLHNMEALEFLKMQPEQSFELALFDPPYSPRQVAEVYKRFGLTVTKSTTQASYWSNLKKELSRIVSKGGVVISAGWNSGGVGKKYGFKIIEILLVSHGAWHNDTILTVDIKL